MGHLATLAMCSLNQWALDFQGNAERILESIRQAKAAGGEFDVPLSYPKLSPEFSGSSSSHREAGTGYLKSICELNFSKRQY